MPGCHWQFGEGRVDFPQKPKGDDTCGEGEAIRAGQSCLWVTEPAGALCPPRASGRGWESIVLPSKEEKLLVLPIDIKLLGGSKVLMKAAALELPGTDPITGEMLGVNEEGQFCFQ